jgi:hypothetical protein
MAHGHTRIGYMSKATVDYLIARIKTSEVKVLRQKFPAYLIVRESG